MNQSNQPRRQLPRRASRGVRTQQTQQQKLQDDQIYNRLFPSVTYSQSSSDQSFENQLGLRPMQTFTANFANYNYGRGYHYFFNLDTFPRVDGSPSYALDDTNRFKHTYSHDQQQINGLKLKNIINRKYIGLPTIQTTYQNKKNKDKNVCHYHLFNIQDKKYHNHRLISKYKYVLKNLNKLFKQNKLKNFTQLRKDVITHQVCQKDIPLQKRREILENRIKILQQRVKNMNPYWNWEDNIYFHFSLDQKFHDQAMQKGQKLSQKYLNDYILKRISMRHQYIQGVQYGSVCLGLDKLKNAVQNWLVFEEQQNNALSIVMQNKLKAMPKIIQMFRKKQELVIFPLFTFNFGSKDIQRVIDPLIKSKLQKDYQNCFYVYKAFVKRLLKRDLACQQQHVAQPMLIQQYTNLMKQKLVQIQQFYQKRQVFYKKNLYADQIVQLDKIQKSPLQQQILLLEPDQKIQISIKQLMLLFFYRNISIALQQFIQYLNYDSQILKFMADSNYQKFHYGIAKILHKTQFCILMNDINRYAQILNNTIILSQEYDKKFYFSFNQKLRIAYVWEEESNDWQTQKDQNDGQQQIQLQNQKIHQNNPSQIQQQQSNSMNDVFENGDPKPSKKQKIQ